MRCKVCMRTRDSLNGPFNKCNAVEIGAPKSCVVQQFAANQPLVGANLEGAPLAFLFALGKRVQKHLCVFVEDDCFDVSACLLEKDFDFCDPCLVA